MRQNRPPRHFWWLSGALLSIILLSAIGIVWLRAQPGSAAVPAALDASAPVSTATPPEVEVAQADQAGVAVAAGTALPTAAGAPPTPSATATSTPTPTLVFTEYVVQPGDYLEAIAAEFGVSVEAIVALNGLENADQINAGATLRLPPPGATVIATSPTPSHTPLPLGGAGGGSATPVATQPVAAAPLAPGVRTLGFSADGRPIEHYVFGDGPADVVFVGAIHGGYEWNTANLAYEIIDHFDRNPGDVPDAVTLHIIPVANPDGLSRVSPGWTTGPIPPPTGVITDTMPGRFNGRDVDLNRNFDCDWAPTGVWRNQQVSGGTAPFSENETAALRDFFLSEAVRVVVFWHSAAGVVLPGQCRPATHAASLALAEVYAAASEYPVRSSLVYEITGDASDWLTTEDIPSFAVELTDHTAMEWERNLAGVLAVLDHYAALCAGGACEPESDR